MSGWGSGWDTSAATASISNGRGKLTAGYAIHQSALPDALGSGLLTVDVVAPQQGDAYDLYLAWADPAAYLVARVEVDGLYWKQSIRAAGGAWFSDDVEVIAGCGTKREPFLGARSFTLHYDRETLAIGGTVADSAAYVLWQCQSVSWTPPNKVGLGHGGGPRAIYFDNVVASDHYVHNPTCPWYGCRCGVIAG